MDKDYCLGRHPDPVSAAAQPVQLQKGSETVPYERSFTDTRPRGTKRREIPVDKPCWETTTETPDYNRIDILKNKIAAKSRKTNR
jgi:hypothetical protein